MGITISARQPLAGSRPCRRTTRHGRFNLSWNTSSKQPSTYLRPTSACRPESNAFMPSYQSAFQLNKVIQAHLLSIRRQAARCPNPFFGSSEAGPAWRRRAESSADRYLTRIQRFVSCGRLHGSIGSGDCPNQGSRSPVLSRLSSTGRTPRRRGWRGHSNPPGRILLLSSRTKPRGVRKALCCTHKHARRVRRSGKACSCKNWRCDRCYTHNSNRIHIGTTHLKCTGHLVPRFHPSANQQSWCAACVPGLHRDGPQQLPGHAQRPTGRTWARTPRARRRERSDGNILERGRPAPVVM